MCALELWKPFSDEFGAEGLTLFSTEHWTVLVRKAQPTLGALVLAANRNFISGAELSADELREFPEVVGRLEGALSAAFQFDKINYLLLMMKDRHYHFHVLPRYESSRHFAGVEWKDTGWPGQAAMAVPEANEETLAALLDHLAKRL